MEYFNRTNIIAFYLIILLGTHNVIASSDDDYLKLLESEAADTKIDQGNGLSQNIQPNNVPKVSVGHLANKEWKGECDYIKDAVPSNLAEEELYSYLKQCAIGTFTYYRRLDFKSKRLIYNNYKISVPVKLQTLRKNILSYF